MGTGGQDLLLLFWVDLGQCSYVMMFSVAAAVVAQVRSVALSEFHHSENIGWGFPTEALPSSQFSSSFGDASFVAIEGPTEAMHISTCLQGHQVSAQAHGMLEIFEPPLLKPPLTCLPACLPAPACLQGYQVFTQACGMLEMLEPRDAFLGTLCEFALSSSSGLEGDGSPLPHGEAHYVLRHAGSGMLAVGVAVCGGLQYM